MRKSARQNTNFQFNMLLLTLALSCAHDKHETIYIMDYVVVNRENDFRLCLSSCVDALHLSSASRDSSRGLGTSSIQTIQRLLNLCDALNHKKNPLHQTRTIRRFQMSSELLMCCSIIIFLVFVGCVSGQKLCSEQPPIVDINPDYGFHAIFQWVYSLDSDDPLHRQRQSDYDNALRITLANPLIETVHLLVEDNRTYFKASDFLDGLSDLTWAISNFTGSTRLQICNLGRRAKYADFTRYAEARLRELPVILTNADIGIGSGLEKVNVRRLASEKLMYAPTRQTLLGLVPEICSCRAPTALGCADTFIFVAQSRQLQRMHEKLEFPFGEVPGCENVFMYESQRVGFKISNPCKSLYMWHFQSVRYSSLSLLEKQYGRINIAGRSAVAGQPRTL